MKSDLAFNIEKIARATEGEVVTNPGWIIYANKPTVNDYRGVKFKMSYRSGTSDKEKRLKRNT